MQMYSHFFFLFGDLHLFNVGKSIFKMDFNYISFEKEVLYRHDRFLSCCCVDKSVDCRKSMSFKWPKHLELRLLVYFWISSVFHSSSTSDYLKSN